MLRAKSGRKKTSENNSIFRITYKVDPNKDTKKEVEAIFKDNEVERSEHITAPGDYRVVSSCRIQVTDGIFNGQFWIKQDTHTFKEGRREMKLGATCSALKRRCA